MSILLVQDLSIKNCQEFNVSKYEKIFLIINKINRDVVEYLLDNNLQDSVTCLINNDNIIKSNESYLIIRNFEFIIFNFKTAVYFSNLINNLLLSKYFQKNYKIINLDSKYNLYSNILKHIINYHIKNSKHIDILNIDKIHNDLLTDENTRHIVVNSLNNKSFTYNNTNFDLKFLHITKNAGTYIEDLGFKNNLVLGKIKDQINDYNLNHKNAIDYYHLTPFHFYNEVFNINYCNNKNINFLIVRNPYDRILSEIFCPWLGIVKNNRTPSIDEINDYLNNKLLNIKNNPKRLFNGGHCALQYSYAYDSNDILVVDEILKFENLTEDLENLIQKYNLKLVLDKEKTNKSSKSCQLSDLTDENIKLINKLYKLDFEKFGYNMISIEDK